MYLELAEAPTRRKAPAFRNYVYIPPANADQEGIFLREDALDTLSEPEFDSFMEEIEPYQTHTGLSAGQRRAARKARREERKQIKTEKKKQKVEKRAAKTDLKKSRAEAKRIKAGAKATRAEKGRAGIFAPKQVIDPETGEVTEVTAGQRAGGFFNKVLDTAGKFIGGKTGADAAGMEPVERDTRPDDSDKKPFYKNPFVIGAGIILAAGTIYAVTRNRPAQN